MKPTPNLYPKTNYFYRAYGHNIASALELPELPELPHTDNCDHDVEIVEHPFPVNLENAECTWSWAQFAKDRCQFSVESIARYRIEFGRRILIDRLDSSASKDTCAIDAVRLCLLGSAFGALLHQKRWLPLHTSSVVTKQGVWAFSGPSGAGKSTLAAWLSDRNGWPLMSDDIGVLNPNDKQPTLHPGPPRLKLWRNSLAKLGIEQHGLFRDLARYDKFHLPQEDKFVTFPEPLKALVLLDHCNGHKKPVLEQLFGPDAFKAVLGSIYRPEFCHQIRAPAQLMSEVAKVISSIKIFRFRRQWSLDSLDEGLQFLSDKMRNA